MNKVIVIGFWIFLISLLGALLGVSIPQMKGEISSEDHLNLVAKIISIYAVHLGVIVGAALGGVGKKEGHVSESRALRAMVIGLFVTWNLLVLYRVAAYDFMPPTEKSFDQLIQYLEAIPRESTFLIAGVLAFFSTRDRG